VERSVRFLLDNAWLWLDEYHLDGLRFDSTIYIRTANGTDGPGSYHLPDGWSILQEINSLVTQKFPGRITIAEDLQNNDWLTKDIGAGGAGFGSQWDADFVHPIRQAVITPQDEQRSLAAIRSSKPVKNAPLKIYSGVTVIPGIIRTHRGAITVESELGQWSASRLFSPASGEEFLPIAT